VVAQLGDVEVVVAGAATGLADAGAQGGDEVRISLLVSSFS
jgi:septum formation inhibitor MinC